VILNDQTAIETSKKLLQINAIKLNPKNPFIWASGINSPIYCDNRLILSEIETRKYICNELCVLINKKFKRTEVIAGVATGAIGIGMMVAQQLNKPFIYIRSSKKQHGRKNSIEGGFIKGQKVIVIEDLISTGMSSIKACNSVIENQLELLGLVSIFTYGFNEAVNNFKNEKIINYSLSSYDYLIKEAVNMKKIDEKEINMLFSWKEDPKKWKF
jgi:orotate phosphoribosyltransferase